MTTTAIKGGFTVNTPLARLRNALRGKPSLVLRDAQLEALVSALKPFAGHKLTIGAHFPSADTTRAISQLDGAFRRAGIDLEVVNDTDPRLPPSFSFGVPANYQDWSFLRACGRALVEMGIAASPIPTVITGTPTLYLSPIG